ncbi:unnamed protein product [Lactuca saligna]|uniref:Uncharacterized protein n=1 Tax=Lactuca saligna TaxID=75948 RepID=A0AA36A468_LACSI|nr:unnamed protein product [Lactuca saligna]
MQGRWRLLLWIVAATHRDVATATLVSSVSDAAPPSYSIVRPPPHPMPPCCCRCWLSDEKKKSRIGAPQSQSLVRFTGLFIAAVILLHVRSIYVWQPPSSEDLQQPPSPLQLPAAGANSPTPESKQGRWRLLCGSSLPLIGMLRPLLSSLQFPTPHHPLIPLFVRRRIPCRLAAVAVGFLTRRRSRESEHHSRNRWFVSPVFSLPPSSSSMFEKTKITDCAITKKSAPAIALLNESKKNDKSMISFLLELIY